MEEWKPNHSVICSLDSHQGKRDVCHTALFFFLKYSQNQMVIIIPSFLLHSKTCFFSMSLKPQPPYLQHEHIIVCIFILHTLAYTELHMRLTTRFYTFLFSGTVNEANQVQI